MGLQRSVSGLIGVRGRERGVECASMLVGVLRVRVCVEG